MSVVTTAPYYSVAGWRQGPKARVGRRAGAVEELVQRRQRAGVCAGVPARRSSGVAPELPQTPARRSRAGSQASWAGSEQDLHRRQGSRSNPAIADLEHDLHQPRGGAGAAQRQEMEGRRGGGAAIRDGRRGGAIWESSLWP